MTVEMLMLVWSGLLSLSLALLTIAIHFLKFGGTTIRSNREKYPALEGIAGRVVRAHNNMTESLLPFAVIVVAAHITHVSNWWTVHGSEAFLVARIAHAGLYVSGVPEVRSVAFYVGLFSTVAIAFQLPIFG